ncbi:MAG: ribose-phosphate diphosphokinase, partial [Syntrophales bacterium]|nr:ribose-phosphate diphosphokinase [Syntrophales bacterium]
CFELIFDQNPKGENVFLFQTSLSDSCSLHKDIWELLEMVNFAKASQALKITVVMPYVSYARSDKIYDEGVAVTGDLLVKLLEKAGMTDFIGIDLHSDRFERFFSCNLHHLSALNVLAEELKSSEFLLPADMGILRKGSILAEKLKIPFGQVKKKRISDTEVEIKEITGDFIDKNIVVFDDEISTGGTLKALSEKLKEAKSITFAVTHGLFVGSAIDNFKKISNLKEIIVTDTVPLRREVTEFLPIKIVSVSNILAQKIKDA